MIEAIFAVLGEFVLQLGLETLFRLGERLSSEGKPAGQPSSPWLAALGYALLGFIFGIFSLVPFPTLLLSGESARLTNLVLTPIAVGACMALMGAWRTSRGQTNLRIDRFAFGYVFALCLALARFHLAM